MNRFQQLLGDKNKKIVMPFFMLGDSTPAQSLEMILSAIDVGVEVLELGIPFSDPVADGLVIQRSAQRALSAGMNFEKALELISSIRKHTDIPICLLLYYNVVFSRGLESAYAALANSGVDAILIADLPPEEAEQHEALLKKYNMGSAYLIAPNTSIERAKLLLQHSSAFTYVVSDYGTTGVRNEIPKTTYERINLLRELATTPLIVGFGISRTEQIRALHAAGAQGAIIASAHIALFEKQLPDFKAAKKSVINFIEKILRGE